MMPIGALLAGALGELLGVRGALWVVTAGISLSGLVFLFSPARHLRDLPQRPSSSEPGPRPETVVPLEPLPFEPVRPPRAILSEVHPKESQ